MLSVAGEKAPLAVHRAAREDIGQQVAGDGLLLQVVERGIDRLDGGLLRQGGKSVRSQKASSITPRPR